MQIKAYQLDPRDKFQWNCDRNLNVFIKKMHFKMSSSKLRLFHLGLDDYTSCHLNLLTILIESKKKKTALVTYGIYHYDDIIMSAMACQITGVSVACSTVCSGADHIKQRSSVLMAFMTSRFPSQRVSNMENVIIWWRHRDSYIFDYNERQVAFCRS